jgi:hypothetical protein
MALTVTRMSIRQTETDRAAIQVLVERMRMTVGPAHIESAQRGPSQAGPSATRADVPNQYWNLAESVASFTRDTFLLGSRSTNPANQPFPDGCYRTSTLQPDFATTWYIASQISADAMMAYRAPEHLSFAIDGADFLSAYLWDHSRVIGGFFAALDIASTNPGFHVDQNSDKWIDDNARVGLAFLDVAEHLLGPDRQRYIGAARSIADFILATRVPGPGFNGLWWSVNAVGTSYGPYCDPTHTLKTCDVRNTIACAPSILLLLRIFALTGISEYGEWAYLAHEWLDNSLFDTTTGLYYGALLQNFPPNLGHYSDDNAIMVEVMLLWAKIGSTVQPWANRAASLAAAMVDHLLQGAFVVQDHDTTCLGMNALGPIGLRWSCRAVRALILMYEATGDVDWLDQAQTALDNMHGWLWSAGGYLGVICSANDVPKQALGIDACDQAWMQHALALLSRHRSTFPALPPWLLAQQPSVPHDL